MLFDDLLACMGNLQYCYISTRKFTFVSAARSSVSL